VSRRKAVLFVAIAGLAIAAAVPLLPRERQVDGYVVHGTLGPEDLLEIETLMQRKTSDPILSIRAAGFDRWEVRTGIVRGPLDGGGDIFVVEK
jgi:hypothetical protein